MATLKKENTTDERFVYYIHSFTQLLQIFASLVCWKKKFMSETEVAISGTSGGIGGDTEIDLYADVVENELDTV